MAACGGLQHIFKKALPENPTLLESLSSWNQINPHLKPIEESSFTELFGELHFREKSQSPPPQSPPAPMQQQKSSFPISSSSYYPPPPSTFSGLLDPEIDKNMDNNDKYERKKSLSLDSFSLGSRSCHRKGESFSSMNYESLQLCTEGLGFESSGDVEEMKNDLNCDVGQHQQQHSFMRHSSGGEVMRRSRTPGGSFPPPISCIGKSGKPSVCFRSYRQNGRFVLEEVRIPTHEFLHACREDGRLKLHLVQPNEDDALEEVDDEDGDEEDEEDNAQDSNTNDQVGGK